MEVTEVLISLGANLGDPVSQIHQALDKLGKVMSNLTWSRFYHTEPLDLPEQPEFINAAARGKTALSAGDLLQFLLDVEHELGRNRSGVPPRGPRLLDLDLILYGDMLVDQPQLHIPHPRFRERRFVLKPANDIAADLVDPVTGLSLAELYLNCQDMSVIRPVEVQETVL